VNKLLGCYVNKNPFFSFLAKKERSKRKMLHCGNDFDFAQPPSLRLKASLKQPAADKEEFFIFLIFLLK